MKNSNTNETKLCESAAEAELEEVIFLWRKLKEGKISLGEFHTVMTLNFGATAE